MAPKAGRGRFAFSALLLANLFMAFGPMLVRMTDVGPVAAAFWRLALAVPLLLLLARGQTLEIFTQKWTVGAVVAVGGLFFAADMAAWHHGILLTKMANATLFGNSSSLLFAIYGFVVLRMLPRPVQLAALLLAAIGAVLLLGRSYELSPRNLRGDLFSLLAGFFYTLYLIAIDRTRRSMGAMPVLAFSSLAGAAPLLLFSLLLGETVMPSDWTPLILLALGSQVLGQGLLVYAMGHLSPLVVGLGLLTQPVAAAAVGWIVYGERLGVLDATGGLLIAAALILIRLPPRLASHGEEPNLGEDRRVR